MEVACSSGTYIRSLIHQLGETLTTGALALSITRTNIGEYDLENAITLD
jgi:tRNA pseudouridine55 synthase